MAHDPEIKAAVVARLIAGDTGTSIHRDMPEVPLRTIYFWRDELDKTAINCNKKSRLDELIEDSIGLQLEAISNIARQTNRQAWLDKQDADKLAVLHGVITDKLYRILATISIKEETDVSDATLISETASDTKR